MVLSTFKNEGNLALEAGKTDAKLQNIYPISNHKIYTPIGSDDHSLHENAFDKALRFAGIGAVAVSLSPIILKQLGIGAELSTFLSSNGNCCKIIAENGPSWTKFQPDKDTAAINTYGVAGIIASTLGKIPAVGGELSKGGIANALAAGGLMVLGHYGGQHIYNFERKRGLSGKIGKLVRNVSQVMGVVVALPAVLPGVGHGLEFLSGLVGIDNIDMEKVSASGPASMLMGYMGKVPYACKGEQKLTDGAYGSSSILLAQLCCAAPAILSALPAIFAGQNKGMDR